MGTLDQHSFLTLIAFLGIAMDIKTLTGCTSSTIISYIKGQPIAYSQQTQSTVVAGGLLLEFRFFYVTIMPLKFFGLLQCARKQVSLVS